MMAMDQNRLIGKDGGMPWHVPGEQAYFKRVTMGKPIIMGRKTYDSIGRPLPGRANIVVTRNNEWHAEGVLIADNLSSAIEKGMTAAAESASSDGSPKSGLPDAQNDVNQKAGEIDEIFIIGGASLCQEAMPVTQRLYLTIIDKAYSGDTWLESFDWSDWNVISEDLQPLSSTGGIPVTYWVLEKATS